MVTMNELNVEPPKAALTNVESGETMRFQFNPPELVEEVSVNWARLSPVGLSHQILHYINTNNHRLPIEIYMSDVVANLRKVAAAPARSGFLFVPLVAPLHPLDTVTRLKPPSPEFNVDNSKRFLQSLVYPVRTESGTSDPPPRVLFIWPSVVRLRCVVTSLRFIHRRFSLKTAATTALMAEVALEESRFLPLSSQFARQFGSRRAP